MRKIISIILATLGFLSIAFGIAYQFKDEIYNYYQRNILKVRDNITISKNEYYKNNNYSYVSNTNDFIAKDKKHLMDIFYTIINSGDTEVTFFCDDSYTTCIKDATNMVKDKEILSNINNFVHPFNSFEKINITYDKYGEINVTVNKTYNDLDIQRVNEIVDSIISKKIKKNMSVNDKIKTIHDYIINNSKYATDKIQKKYPYREFDKANDILEDGIGLCSAYTDAMAIFLYRFGLDNYKVASDSHVWNLVKINKKWYHLDLTWDDPVTENGSNKLEVLFLLIDTDRLNEFDTGKHNFNKDIYKEALKN